MISIEKYQEIKEKYGYYASWAVWAEEGDTPKSNVGDLTVLDPINNNSLLESLQENMVTVALNISRGAITTPYANFHDKRSEATDFKIRYAFKGTKLWGSYMTDLFKDYDEKSSSNVKTYIKNNPSFVIENVKFLQKELEDIGDVKTLVAFGLDVYKYLQKYFKDSYEIVKIPHYANYFGKEKYREIVLDILCNKK